MLFLNIAFREALFLSEKEENIITGILHNIQEESLNNMDKFSHPIVISHLELLLKLCRTVLRTTIFNKS